MKTRIGIKNPKNLDTVKKRESISLIDVKFSNSTVNDFLENNKNKTKDINNIYWCI